MTKKRLDTLVHEKALVSTRAQASMLIKKSGVWCDGVLLRKPGLKVSEDSELRLEEQQLYVSRGAYKLIAALDQFKINTEERVCADIGASTGGFVEVLLERGAGKVYAIDVGHDQLATKLRSHPQVINMEGVNAKFPVDLPELVDIVVSDLSHISMIKVLPSALKMMKPSAVGVWLIKPQFEAGRERIGKNGIVDQAFHSEILKEVSNNASKLGVTFEEIIQSPIEGKKGNTEYLTWFTR